MAGIVERDQSLKREDLSDLLTIVDRKSTPFSSEVKKGTAPRNSLLEWGVDKHKANLVQTATYSSGVSNNIPIDGADTTSSDFENYDDRAKCQVYVQYSRRFPKVSRLANMTSDIAELVSKKKWQIVSQRHLLLTSVILKLLFALRKTHIKSWWK